MKRDYPDSKSDLFAAFIERCLLFTLPHGIAALITMQSWMFLSSYEKLRLKLLSSHHIASMLHLGTRAFDSIGGEVVSSTAFVLTNATSGVVFPSSSRRGTFIRLVDEGSEAGKIKALRDALDAETGAALHFASSDDFSSIPGSPIVYWLSEKMRAAFLEFPPLSAIAEPRQGIATADNDRFLRYWWEPTVQTVSLEDREDSMAIAHEYKWFPMHKGGAFRKWYGNHDFVVDWLDDGREIKNFRDASGRQLSRPQNLENNFKPGVTWTAISSGGFAARFGPSGYLSNAKGPMLYPNSDHRLAVLGCINAATAQKYLDVLSPTLDYSQGPLGKLPLPNLPEAPNETVEALVHSSQRDWDAFETSFGFEGNPLVALALGSTQHDFPV